MSRFMLYDFFFIVVEFIVFLFFEYLSYGDYIFILIGDFDWDQLFELEFDFGFKFFLKVDESIIGNFKGNFINVSMDNLDN